MAYTSSLAGSSSKISHASISGNNLAMFFAKDVLLVLVYISFYAAGKNGKEKAIFRPPFLVPLLIFVWFAAGQVFNLASTSLFFGFLGMKFYFLQRTGRSAAVKLFPSHVEVPADDPQVARVLLRKVRLERTPRFGACYLGLELWKRLDLDRFFEQALDCAPAGVLGRALQRRSCGSSKIRRSPTPASFFRTSGHCLVAARFVRGRYVRRYTACPLVGARTAFTVRWRFDDFLLELGRRVDVADHVSVFRAKGREC
jgi:hypothetical protein